MGCAVSRSSKEECDVVSLCRERKRLIKSAVERRCAFAQAYCKYNQSLYAVALAIRLFIARHSSPTSPFLITFPQATDPTHETIRVSQPIYFQQRSSEPTTHKAIARSASKDSVFSERENGQRERDDGEDDSDDDEDDEEERLICQHFYDEVGPPIPSTQNDSGWDFFNPFNGFVDGFGQSWDDGLRALRKAEGIPELEEDEERETRRERREVVGGDGGGVVEQSGIEDVRTVNNANASQGEHKGMIVIDTPTKGRELLEALKDVEDLFIKAFDSGVDVSKMLETNMVHFQSGLEELKETPKKLIQSITWHRSTSSRSSSCKSFLSSSSKSSSTWTEFNNDLFDEFGSMESGSHSLTLGRLYAWEKKLYEEVKAGHQLRKTYGQKFLLLRNQNAKGDSFESQSEVRDLYSRVSVAIRSVESISKMIQKLRDEELQPQLIELLNGLMKTWKVLLELHQTQKQIMLEVKSLTSPAFGKFSNDFHRLATLQLEAEIQNWSYCFAGYVSAQKEYIKALKEYLSKFISPDINFYSRDRSLFPKFRFDGPPLLVICHNWLASLERLPDRAAACAMKSFGKDIRALGNQQGIEQQQKRKVDGLAKELDTKLLEFQKAEGKILELKLSEQKMQVDVRRRVEYLEERKAQLDVLGTRLDSEKARHHGSMQETEWIILNGLQTGFSSVFDSLTQFSKASLQMYTDLVAHGKEC